MQLFRKSGLVSVVVLITLLAAASVRSDSFRLLNGAAQNSNIGGYLGAVSITGNRVNGADQVSHANINGTINVQTYGAKCDNGTTDNGPAFSAAIAGALTAGKSHSIYVPGCSQGQFYQINVATNGTGINLSSSSAAVTTTNAGVSFIGDGIDLSVIQFHQTGTNNTGIGIDLSGASYFNLRGMRINSGASTADTVRTAVLLGKVCSNGVSPCSGANILFSGNGIFDGTLITRYGDYGIYDLGAENISFRDLQIPATGTTTTPTIVISRANTAGLTSPNVTLNSPADSMTAVSFSGFGQSLGSNGPEAVLLDVGGTTGIASISFSDAYMPLTNATGIAIVSNGTGASVIDRVECRNCKIEANGGAGTNQVFSLSAGTVKDVFFTGTLSSTVAQTAAEFVWANPLVNSYIDWDPNDAGAGPATLFSTTGNPAAKGSIFRTAGLLSTINGLAAGTTGSWIEQGSDGTWILSAPPSAGANGIDRLPIGVNVPSSGAFTTLSAITPIGQASGGTGTTTGSTYMWSGITQSVLAATTDFISFGENAGGALIATELNAENAVLAATASNLKCVQATAAGAAGDVYTVDKNGVATALTCTVASTGTSCTDATHTFTTVLGDLLSIKVAAGASSPTGTATCVFQMNS